MAIQITNFSISSDRTSLEISITDADEADELRLWTSDTYKDYNQAYDLSSFLVGGSEEVITVPVSFLELTYFDGVYFLEVSDVEDSDSAITSELTRYKECILNKILNILGCDDCLTFRSDSLMNAQTLLTSLETAIENSFVDEIILITNTLNMYCSNTCKTCGEFRNITDTTAYDINTPI